MPLSINHYLNNMPMLTDQWNAYNYKEPNRQRIYLKDIDCPQLWHDKLKDQIPPGVFYLNDSTGDIGGPASVEEPNPHGLGLRKSKGAARAGDLMSCLPPPMRAENMMCYIGHEGTYTPAHREMCASLGQNLMVETSGNTLENGKFTKPGSSIWFMTETKDRFLVSEYWLSTLGHDIEVEAHFAQINAWKAAPFTTYVVEQKLGDFILIPPLAPHQVWNRGTRTIKVAWNRTTVETLEMALAEAVPRARLVCRDEQYKNKAIVLFSLQRYSGFFNQVALQKQTASDQQTLMDLTYSPKIRQLQKDFKRLFTLYTEILLSESPAVTSPPEKRMQYLPYDSNITCSYCRCNIFNRFLTCTICVAPLENGDEDSYDICLECYTMGRSCQCLSRLKWVEQFPWKDLVEKHELWRSQIIDFEDVTETSPQALDVEKKAMKKKTLAEICQEQLKLRPWRDPKKPQEVEEFEVESDEFNKDGTVKKKRKKRRSEKWLQENVCCHICVHRSPRWKHAICGCGLAFCYGSLWRAFDMMPQTVMEDRNWKCPRCLKCCSCSTCRKDPKNKPFEPSGTILGHDTKKFADPRSIESLVDFSHSNMHWVRKAGDDHPHETRRLQRRQEEAQKAKLRDPTLDEHYVDDELKTSTPSSAESGAYFDGTQYEMMPIDPMLDPSLAPRSTHRIRGGTTHPARSSVNLAAKMQAPVTNMVSTRPLDGLPIQRAALEALSVMNSSHNGYHGHGGEAGYQQNNGISYEYPDPDGPTLSPQTTDYVQNHPPPAISEVTAPSQKRKRLDEPAIVRSDLPVSLEDGALLSVQQSRPSKMVKKTHKEACNSGKEDTISSRKKTVVFQVQSSKLASITQKASMHQELIAYVGEDVDDGGDSTVIISSDLPTASTSMAHSPPKQIPTKRKWAQGEDDDDFTVGKKNRKSTAALESKRTFVTKSSYTTMSESDKEDEAYDEQSLIHGKKPSPKRRSLPAYLARRSPVGISELPEKLPGTSSRRTSQVPQQNLSHNNSENIEANNSPAAQRPVETTNSTETTAKISYADTDINSRSSNPAHHADSDRNGDFQHPALNGTSHAETVVVPGSPQHSGKETLNGVTSGSIKAIRNAKRNSVTASEFVAQKDIITNSVKTAEANRKAKLNAMNWAQSDVGDVESDYESEQSLIELTQPKLSKSIRPVCKRGATLPTAHILPAAKGLKRSIFSRLGNRKIRITAAKLPDNGMHGK